MLWFCGFFPLLCNFSLILRNLWRHVNVSQVILFVFRIFKKNIYQYSVVLIYVLLLLLYDKLFCNVFYTFCNRELHSNITFELRWGEAESINTQGEGGCVKAKVFTLFFLVPYLVHKLLAINTGYLVSFTKVSALLCFFGIFMIKLDRWISSKRKLLAREQIFA